MANKIKIQIRGEDGYKVSSVRLKIKTWEALDEIAEKTKRSRNEVISILLNYGLENAVIEKETAE